MPQLRGYSYKKKSQGANHEIQDNNNGSMELIQIELTTKTLKKTLSCSNRKT